MMTAMSKAILGCKLIELAIACTCMGLYVHTPMRNIDVNILARVVYGGYIIILCGSVLGFLTGERTSRKVDLFYSLVGMAIFVAAGSAIINITSNDEFAYYHTKKYGAIGGSFAILNAFIFLIDAALTYRGVHEYTQY